MMMTVFPVILRVDVFYILNIKSLSKVSFLNGSKKFRYVRSLPHTLPIGNFSQDKWIKLRKSLNYKMFTFLLFEKHSLSSWQTAFSVYKVGIVSNTTHPYRTKCFKCYLFFIICLRNLIYYKY